MQENPLKQYFRRPAIYIQLPSKGRFYTEDVIDMPPDGEIPVYPMSAIDEITSRTPDALYNGHAIVEIIKSCIPTIKDPWAINTIDFESLLIAIRIASSGDEMDITVTCPSCSEESKFGVNMTSVLAGRHDVNYAEILKIRELEIKFRPLTYRETNKNNMNQYEIQKLLIDIGNIENDEIKNSKLQQGIEYLNNLTTTIISDTIEWIRTPEATVVDKEYIKDFLVNCDRQTSNAIRDHSIKLREKSNLPDFNITCPNCKHEWKQPLVLNITDFFG